MEMLRLSRSWFVIAIMSTATSAFAADCKFGAFCDKTLELQIPSTKVCINGRCDESGLAQDSLNIFFSSDGFLMTQFATVYVVAPGISSDTYVCRAAPSRPVNESCKGETCKFDPGRRFDSFEGQSSCSFEMADSTLQLTFNSTSHQHSTVPGLEKESSDGNLRINLKISPSTTSSDDCAASLDVAQDSTDLDFAGRSTKSSYSFAGTTASKKYHRCKIANGVQLLNRSRLGGKIVDPGPAVALRETYPPLHGEKVYIVPLSEANGSPADTLYIPDGVTLKAAPDVKSINWQFRRLRFGKDTTIDLSAPTAKPPSPGSVPPLSQADYCIPGADGSPGSPGDNGRPGVSLTITGIENVDDDGSLWIETSGGPGADGGKGQDGQQGGGRDRRFLHKGLGEPCRSGYGGNGGAAGRGGKGGDTSTVVLQFFDYDVHQHITFSADALDCNDVKPPNREIHRIAIWGHVGCAGDGGQGGRGGLAGEADSPAGISQTSGLPGLPGQMGDVRLDHLF